MITTGPPGSTRDQMGQSIQCRNKRNLWNTTCRSMRLQVKGKGIPITGRRRKKWNDHVERIGPDRIVRKAKTIAMLSLQHEWNIQNGPPIASPKGES